MERLRTPTLARPRRGSDREGLSSLRANVRSVFPLLPSGLPGSRRRSTEGLRQAPCRSESPYPPTHLPDVYCWLPMLSVTVAVSSVLLPPARSEVPRGCATSPNVQPVKLKYPCG